MDMDEGSAGCGSGIKLPWSSSPSLVHILAEILREVFETFFFFWTSEILADGTYIPRTAVKQDCPDALHLKSKSDTDDGCAGLGCGKAKITLGRRPLARAHPCDTIYSCHL
eukprot:5618217-Karenia_brevis.AAC.1